MADLDKLLVDKLHASMAGDFEELDLRLYQEVESHFGNEETRSGTGRVSDGCADIKGGQVGGRIDRLEGATKDRVEDVVDTRAATEFLGRDLGRGTIDGGDERVGKTSHLLEDKRATVLLATEVQISIAGELLLGLTHEGVEAGLDVGQSFSDMSHESCVEGLGKVVGAASDRNVSVGRVVLEEVGLGLKSLFHGLVALDILLRAVDNTNKAELQRVDSTREDVEGVGSMIHQINLGQDTDGPSAERVYMASKLESFRIDNVDIGGGNGKDNTVGLGDVFRDEVSGLLLNIGGLVSYGNLRKIMVS